MNRAAALAICALQAVTHFGAQPIRIDGRAAGRTFDGIGAISAGASTRLLPDYPDQQRREILDLLFKPNYGASLQHLKVEIGGDTNSTDGAEPTHARTRAELSNPNFHRGYEWWLMKEAAQRNSRIVLDTLIWGAPGWVGSGNFSSQDTADYVVKFLQGAKSVHGLDILYTGVWNEKPTTLDYIKLLKRTLVANHLATKLICCDLTPHRTNYWSLVQDIRKDPELKAAVDVLGFHYADIDVVRSASKDAFAWDNAKPVRPPAYVLDAGVPLWGTEDHPVRRIWREARENDWVRGGELAKLYNQNYIERRFTKTESWALVTSYYDNLPAPTSGLMYANTPWSGHYRVQTTIWATAHTTQFAQPGWQYLDSACGYLKGKGSYVALKAPGESGDFSIIVETIDATESQPVRFELANLKQDTVYVWRSKELDLFRQVAKLTPRDGAITVELEPGAIYSLTTTTGQYKAPVKGRPDTGFPLPYADDFERTAVGKTPKYLSDQNGAFESAACTGRKGRCLQQSVEQEPIGWTAGKSSPTTILGDMNWRDYEVSADARLDRPGTVSLLGRLGKIGKFTWGGLGPSYILSLAHDGRWELSYPREKEGMMKLAGGRAAAGPGAWRNLRLTFRGTNIRAFIDGKLVADVHDDTYRTGMAGVGSGWHLAQFDNFRIDR